MIKPVRFFPDPVLGGVCQPVGPIDDAALALAADLVDTMRASEHSVGVAAPQIGVARRAFCIDVSGHRKARSCHGELVLFDPVVESSDGVDIGREGCMSVPDLTGVEQPSRKRHDREGRSVTGRRGGGRSCRARRRDR